MKNEMVAMILAGGQGSRLGALTKNLPKPVVSFGGKYCIIDFVLSNCSNSGISTVGIVTQYKPLALNSYIGNGAAWDLDRSYYGVCLLPPYMGSEGGEWFKGTANAIYQNISYIDLSDPDYVLVLSGDHVYKMDYAKMLDFHKVNNADATVACIETSWEEASRFGIMDLNEEGRIIDFEEKPIKPKSNLASMGVYIFSKNYLYAHLEADEHDSRSNHDFGKNIIPNMLHSGGKVFGYKYSNYWRDIGTIASLWEANMDLLKPNPELDLFDKLWVISSKKKGRPSMFIEQTTSISNCLIDEGCRINGSVNNSILSVDVTVEKDAKITNSILMPGAKIGIGSVINKAFIGPNAIIEDHVVIDSTKNQKVSDSDYCGITVIGDNAHIVAGAIINDGGRAVSLLNSLRRA